MELITLVAIVIAIQLKFKIPTQEFNFIIVCLILEFFGFASYSVTYFYSSPTQIDDSASNFSGLGYFLTITSIMFVTYVILLIDFRGSNHQIIEFAFFSWIGGVTAVYNGITFHLKLVNGSIETSYLPLGILFIIAFYCFVIYIWVIRFIQIVKVYEAQESKNNALNELFIFIIFGIILIFIYVFFVIIFNIQSDYSFIAGGILTIIGIGLLVKNNAFVFVTDINLDSIIIIEKISGIRIYSKLFDSNLTNDDDSDFIGSIISSINISFSDTIRSHKDLTEMTFSNKTVIVFSGEFVRSIVIVSSSNLMAKGISKYIVKKFEKKYGNYIKEKISKNEFVSRITDYKDFESDIKYVRKFLPL